jgi:hypothetical protein
VILLARPNIIGLDMLPQIRLADSTKYSDDPEYYRETGQPVPEHINQNQQSRTAIGLHGPVISFVGTLINAFADLLNYVVGFHP